MLDQNGNIAAGTTGGMTTKNGVELVTLPLLVLGLTNNSTWGVFTDKENILWGVVAHDISAMMSIKNH